MTPRRHAINIIVMYVYRFGLYMTGGEAATSDIDPSIVGFIASLG